MVERSPARLLAPLALVAFAVVLVLVIATSGGTPTSPRAPAPTADRRGPPGRQAQMYYLVKRGDNLSKIAVRTGVPLERLKELNPGLDPIALRPGQRIKLRP